MHKSLCWLLLTLNLFSFTSVQAVNGELTVEPYILPSVELGKPIQFLVSRAVSSSEPKVIKNIELKINDVTWLVFGLGSGDQWIPKPGLQIVATDNVTFVKVEISTIKELQGATFVLYEKMGFYKSNEIMRSTITLTSPPNKPELKIHPNNTDAHKENSTIEISCSTSFLGLPALQLSLEFNGAILLNREFDMQTNRNGEGIIRRRYFLTWESNGAEINCKIGDHSEKKTINVFYMPREMDLKIISSNSSTTLTKLTPGSIVKCTARANPPAIVSWEKNMGTNEIELKEFLDAPHFDNFIELRGENLVVRQNISNYFTAAYNNGTVKKEFRFAANCIATNGENAGDRVIKGYSFLVQDTDNTPVTTGNVTVLIVVALAILLLVLAVAVVVYCLRMRRGTESKGNGPSSDPMYISVDTKIPPRDPVELKSVKPKPANNDEETYTQIIGTLQPVPAPRSTTSNGSSRQLRSPAPPPRPPHSPSSVNSYYGPDGQPIPVEV